MLIVGAFLFCLAGSGCNSTACMVVGGLLDWLGQNAAYSQPKAATPAERDWPYDGGY
jgi:hypothetical protein